MSQHRGDLPLRKARDDGPRGLDHLADSSADVVLTDLQFAPAPLDQKEAPTPATQEMQEMQDIIAKDSGVALFRRFKIMRHWPIGQGN
jgi:hypothetical protein